MRSGRLPRLARRKIKSLPSLIRLARQAASQGRVIVFTNGCFDILHAGHLRLLERARRLGDMLIVAVNSDRSVRSLKGPGRPITAQRDRTLLLGGLEPVDYIVVFHEPTPRRLIERLRPHILVKGADWSASQLVGREVVERHGGRVVRFPLLRGRSTSSIIERIRRSSARRRQQDTQRPCAT